MKDDYTTNYLYLYIWKRNFDLGSEREPTDFEPAVTLLNDEFNCSFRAHLHFC